MVTFSREFNFSVDPSTCTSVAPDTVVACGAIAMLVTGVAGVAGSAGGSAMRTGKLNGEWTGVGTKYLARAIIVTEACGVFRGNDFWASLLWRGIRYIPDTITIEHSV